jgi:hypothetical protein
MIRKACLCIFTVMAGIGCVWAEVAQPDSDSVLTPQEAAENIVTAKSASGRFLVVGQNRFDVHDLTRWVDDLAHRFVKVTGQELPKSRSPLIRVYVSRKKDTASAVTATSRLEHDVLSHSVFVVNYEAPIVELLMEQVTICLTLTVIEQAQREIAPRPRRTVVPNWLTQGIAQNLYPELRKRNSAAMLAKWTEGRMLPLKQITGDDATGIEVEELRMARGLLVGWLLSFGDDALLPRVFSETVQTGYASSDEIEALLEGVGVSDAGRGWDAWMLRQKRTVYLPGAVRIKDLVSLKRLLLIYPEDFGISLTDNGDAVLDVYDLIRHKKNKSVRKAAESRFVELQLKSAGSDESFKTVVSAYSKFFNGVAGKKADWRLKRYLEDAERKVREFETQTLSVHTESTDALEKEAVTE